MPLYTVIAIGCDRIEPKVICVGECFDTVLKYVFPREDSQTYYINNKNDEESWIYGTIHHDGAMWFYNVDEKPEYWTRFMGDNCDSPCEMYFIIIETTDFAPIHEIINNIERT